MNSLWKTIGVHVGYGWGDELLAIRICAFYWTLWCNFFSTFELIIIRGRNNDCITSQCEPRETQVQRSQIISTITNFHTFILFLVLKLTHLHLIPLFIISICILCYVSTMLILLSLLFIW